jgi:hypothetical protein
MPDEKFKLPTSSYEELVKIIKAYGNVTQPVSLEEVSQRSVIHRTIISGNAGFLTAIGILESGSKKISTPIGKELALALEHNMREQIRDSWRKVVGGHDFFEKLLTAIKIRNGMDENTLEAHILYSAGQPKKQKFMTGARTIVDILRAAALIIESDGKITALERPEIILPDVVKEFITGEQKAPVKEKRQPGPEVSSGVDVRVNIQVNINCVPTDLEELAGKLKTLIREISLDRKNNDEKA